MFVLSTCNRVEVYAVAGVPGEARMLAFRHLCRYRGVEEATVDGRTLHGLVMERVRGRTLADLSKTLAGADRTLAGADQTLAGADRALAGAQRSLAGIDGAIEVNGVRAEPRDGVAVTGEEKLTIRAIDDAEIVSAELPLEVSCGRMYTGLVTVRNTGSTAWSGR